MHWLNKSAILYGVEKQSKVNYNKIICKLVMENFEFTLNMKTDE